MSFHLPLNLFLAQTVWHRDCSKRITRFSLERSKSGVGFISRYLYKNILKIMRMWFDRQKLSTLSSKNPSKALCGVRSWRRMLLRRWCFKKLHKDRVETQKQNKCSMFSVWALHREHRGLSTRLKRKSLSLRNRILFKILYWKTRLYVSVVENLGSKYIFFHEPGVRFRSNLLL